MSEATPPLAARQNGHAVAEPGKYLTFKLGHESYGIPVLKVREIIRLCPITLVANMPAHVKGVINLRGKVIPLVDLRTKFGLPVTLDNERTCIVVTQIASASGGAPTPISSRLLISAARSTPNSSPAWPRRLPA